MILTSDLYAIAREGLLLALMLSLPILGAAFLAGVLLAVLQTFTKLSEPALTYIPRIAAVTLAVLFAAPWGAQRVAAFAEHVWSLIQTVNH